MTNFRKMLLGVEMEKKEFAEVDEFGRPVTKDSHQELAALKEKNLKLKSAFGLGDDFVDGSSFSRNRAAIEKAEKETKKNYKMVSSDDDDDADDDDSSSKKKKKKKKSGKDKKRKGAFLISFRSQIFSKLVGKLKLSFFFSKWRSPLLFQIIFLFGYSPTKNGSVFGSKQ